MSSSKFVANISVLNYTCNKYKKLDTLALLDIGKIYFTITLKY